MNNQTSEKKKLTDEALRELSTADIETLINEYEVNKFGYPQVFLQINKVYPQIYFLKIQTIFQSFC